MAQDNLKKHDWEKVREALYALEEYAKEHESYAANFINAIGVVLDNLPEEE